ncbi:hypothetical protein THASP1DRAFT_29785 [Thamnocephalis sphaerospora]|uniref:Uncharacterized protein n=1 Tax=Thamnocephalis sphaerospora TaxID=78915 RepID=A0A4P9XQT4_9FUNG|nr:hypothetical protein THASP1DRAFT_29785 [Thamnocephalis sphaerospora]|eukprot:RKP08406.1 hypothetical protein THASP1DRAFT_29785 [Thamnocephalis sphaerospora]
MPLSVTPKESPAVTERELAARRRQPRLFLSLGNHGLGPAVREVALSGSNGGLATAATGSSYAHATIGSPYRRRGESPLAECSPSSPLAQPAVALGQAGHGTLGKRHSQVAAWVAETRRMLSTDWVSRVSKGYGLDDDDDDDGGDDSGVNGNGVSTSSGKKHGLLDTGIRARPPLPQEFREVAGASVATKQTFAPAAVEAQAGERQSEKDTAPQLRQNNISHSGANQSNGNPKGYSGRLWEHGYDNSGDKHNTSEAGNDDEDDDDDRQLRMLLSSVRDEEAVHLTRLARGYAEQRRANRTSIGSSVDLTNTSAHNRTQESLLPLATTGRSASESSQRPPRLQGTPARDTTAESDVHISASTWDRSDRCKTNLQNRYNHIYAQMAEHGNYNPLDERRKKQQQQQQHAASETYSRASTPEGTVIAGSRITSATPAAIGRAELTHLRAPASSRAPAETGAYGKRSILSSMDPDMSNHHHHNNHNNSNEEEEEEGGVDEDDDMDEDEGSSQASSSSRPFQRRGRTLAREIKQVLAHARLKNPLRRAISRTRQRGHTRHNQSESDITVDGEVGPAENPHDARASGSESGDPMRSSQSMPVLPRDRVAGQPELARRLRSSTLPVVQEKDEPVRSPKSLDCGNVTFERSPPGEHRKALSEKQMPARSRLRFSGADRPVSLARALESPDSAAKPVYSRLQALQESEELRSALMSERVVLLFKRFHEQNAYVDTRGDDTFLMRRLIEDQGKLAELEITLRTGKIPMYHEFIELLGHAQTNEREVRQFTESLNNRWAAMDGLGQRRVRSAIMDDMHGGEAHASTGILARKDEHRTLTELIESLNEHTATFLDQLEEVTQSQRCITEETRGSLARTSGIAQQSGRCFQQLNMLADEHQRFMAAHQGYWMELVYSLVSYLLEGAAFAFWIVALLIIYIRRIILLPKTLFSTRGPTTHHHR